jgi:hypothetical protein
VTNDAVAALVARNTLDADLAALLETLVDHGVPLVVAGRDAAEAERVSIAFGGTRGGVLVADSLAEVVRLAGGRGSGELPDELRDIGLVVIVRKLAQGDRVVAAHYVRPLERDAGGHVQRRGPAVLATFDEASGWSHFWWALTGELAERAAMERHALEDAVERRRRELEAFPAGHGQPR